MTDTALRALGIKNPAQARINANRSDASRRAWQTRRARAAAVEFVPDDRD